MTETLTILFFIWVAATNGVEIDKIKDRELERCRALHPRAELTVWGGMSRKYRFFLHGLENANLWNGWDIICSITERRVNA